MPRGVISRKTPGDETPDGGLLWSQKAMNINGYAAEKRIAHERNSDSVHAEHISEGAEDVKGVGEHLITEEAEFVPGKHPEPSRRHKGQTKYLERYLRCIKCDIEVLSERDLPEGCDA